VGKWKFPCVSKILCGYVGFEKNYEALCWWVLYVHV